MYIFLLIFKYMYYTHKSIIYLNVKLYDDKKEVFLKRNIKLII